LASGSAAVKGRPTASSRPKLASVRIPFFIVTSLQS
jgi:hypothetical protein